MGFSVLKYYRLKHKVEKALKKGDKELCKKSLCNFMEYVDRETIPVELLEMITEAYDFEEKIQKDMNNI